MPSSGEREELAILCCLASDLSLVCICERDSRPPSSCDGAQCREMVAIADALLASGYRRPAGWRPISEASRETCAEILGVQFAGGRMMREPFISFWSPTLNKFYCDPTHFQPLPLPPEEDKI